MMEDVVVPGVVAMVVKIKVVKAIVVVVLVDRFWQCGAREVTAQAEQISLVRNGWPAFP